MESKEYPLAESQVNVNLKLMHAEDFLGFFNFRVGQKLRVWGYLKQSQPIYWGYRDNCEAYTCKCLEFR